jgi:acrylyl-CoA reductase (NADPH)
MPRALVLEKTHEAVTASVLDIQEDRLPAGEVLVEVLYSSLNYKDALAVTGKGKVVRASYPFVPGIDLVGRILASPSRKYRRGDLVLATGWGLGESRWGGYSSVQRLEASQLVPLPEAMKPETAMTAGTAGLTAMLSVMSLESLGISPDRGRVLVTGASGGVGSFAVAILSEAGYRVDASTGSKNAHAYLRRLGADRIIDREELSSGAARPLDTATWGAAVDVVGGSTLEAVVSRLNRHGAVAVCGLAGGSELNTSVFPFILRGVSLLGIDSNTCPADVRENAWKRLAELATGELVGEIRMATIGLEEIPDYSERLLAGQLRGRVVVDVKAREAT